MAADFEFMFAVLNKGPIEPQAEAQPHCRPTLCWGHWAQCLSIQCHCSERFAASKELLELKEVIAVKIRRNILSSFLPFFLSSILPFSLSLFPSFSLSLFLSFSLSFSLKEKGKPVGFIILADSCSWVKYCVQSHAPGSEISDIRAPLCAD